jgi:pyruvate formate lyase activating enzyme
VTTPRTATVFDVQRFSIHDGPGIRTVVFFKGCALACEWCHNPEALNAAPELTYSEHRCLEGCSLCTDVCPEDAIRADRVARVDFTRCTACGDCADVCPTKALRLIGRPMTAGELLGEAVKDRPFYRASGGGITLSGGEPVLHGAFLREFLPLAKAASLHVAVETSAAYPFARIEPLLPHLDLVLFDLKVVDPARHERYTARDNRQILHNLAELVRRRVPLEVRMPVVPERNTDARNLAAIARLLADLGVGSLTLLPYNHLWEAKLPRLATTRAPLGIQPPGDDFYDGLQAEFARLGLATHR